VRPDPGGASDDRKLTGIECFSPNDKVSDWIADRLAEGSTGIAAWGSTIPPWCRHRVGTGHSFLNINIFRCLDSKTSCKIKYASYSLTNKYYRRHNC
jgi:hypothetical protein